MSYDNKYVAEKLRSWEEYLDVYKLPDWEEIPDFGLYMDQVISLLKRYLDYLPPDIKEEQFITATAINNYVRKRIMPEPIKKKYYRTHIAYLIIICTLKHCLSIPTLQTMIPPGLSDDELKKTYTAYAARHRVTSQYFIKQVRSAAAGILERDHDSEISTDSTEDLITAAAVTSAFSRLLAEKLLLLNGRTAGEQSAPDGASAERP